MSDTIWSAKPDEAAKDMMAAFRAMGWEFDDGDCMNSICEMLAYAVATAYSDRLDTPIGAYNLVPSSLVSDLRAIARAADKIY